jgi:hypothetical protein
MILFFLPPKPFRPPCAWFLPFASPDTWAQPVKTSKMSFSHNLILYLFLSPPGGAKLSVTPTPSSSSRREARAEAEVELAHAGRSGRGGATPLLGDPYTAKHRRWPEPSARHQSSEPRRWARSRGQRLASTPSPPRRRPPSCRAH